MKAYKLTDKNDQTYGKCQWGENVEHRVRGWGDLCTNGWIHFYKNPLLAVLLNALHGNYNLDTAYLWECNVSGRTKEDRGLKWGASRVKTIKRVELPKITIEQRIKFGILCALEVYYEKSFVKWAKDWLSGKDRSRKAADAAYTAAYTARAAHTARAAAYAVDAAYAVNAAYTAAYTVDAATYAAYAVNAAYAATYAAYAAYKRTDLNKIANETMEE